ncbi:DUF397 domain-containing protein [Streptomyces sp. NPDC020951]|uniref:DUF397 domain-containing protein n=1 Tax=Streptomyces sp. NPDC020951 TaxID=3365104 RepID=UPI00378F913F
MAIPENWQKSSYSGDGDGDNCLELASTPAARHLRESDDPAVALTASPAPLAYLLHAVHTGTSGIVSPP